MMSLHLPSGLGGFSLPVDSLESEEVGRDPSVGDGLSGLTGSFPFKLEGLTVVSGSLLLLSVSVLFSLDFLSPTDFRLTKPNGDFFSSAVDFSGDLAPAGICRQIKDKLNGEKGKHAGQDDS